MNRRGFTLIELLAVIIILGLVMVIVIPNSINGYKKSRLKVEESFISRLSESIDSYVSLETIGSNLKYNKGSFTKTKTGEDTPVMVYEDVITFNDLINSNIISKSDFIDPNSKKNCDVEASISIYKDSDFVYCHRVLKSSLNDCLSDDYKEEHNEEYIIDTCSWEEAE